MKLNLSLGRKHGSHPPATDRVRDLSSQGFSDPEIIRSLRKEGYSPVEADQAMKVAMKAAALATPPQPSFPPAARAPQQEFQPSAASREFFDDRPQDLPGLPEIPPRPSRQPPRDWDEPQPRREIRRELPAEEPFPGEAPEGPAPEELEEEFIPPVRRRAEPGASTEEVVEGLIEEKWGMFEKEVEELSQRMDRANERLSALEATVSQFKGVRKDDVQQIKESIDGYRENLDQIGERLEGMERAVKDSLTPMMQSLRSLSDTLKVMKTEK